VSHPLPIGTRVHHCGGIYSISFFLSGSDDLEGHDDGGPYWGTVLEVKGPYADGSYEYLVERDSPHDPDEPHGYAEWASYHIDRQFQPERPVCPDGGTCHHACPGRSCFRVNNCAPLSGVYVNDEWPLAIR
jgi:hypothetical protein